MIRQQFKVNPWTLCEADFIQLSIEALYLKEQDAELMTGAVWKALSHAFGEK